MSHPHGALAIVVAALAALALLWGAGALVRRALRARGVYLFPRTMAGPAAVYTVEGDDGSPVRVLSVRGRYQSATYLDERYCDLVFAYDGLYDLAFCAGIDVRDVCMLGGGGYAYPKHLVATRPEARIDVVEIDPLVTAIARRYFFLDRLAEEYDTDATGRLRAVCADGRAWLEGRARDAGAPRYDAILNDSFSGGAPARSLTTLEAARAAHACLAPGGVYLSNVVAALEGDGGRFLRAVVRTLGEVFAHVWVVPCGAGTPRERDNNMVVATDADASFPGAVRVEVSEADPILTDARNPVRRLTR